MSKLVSPSMLFAQTTLIVCMLATVNPADAAGRINNTGIRTTISNAGLLTPPVAALRANGMPGNGIHALGFTPNPAAPRAAPFSTFLAVPASVDLSQYNPPVGDQGGLGSCVSWATGYYLRGWYAKRDGYYPAGGAGNTGSFAPMYLYSQLTHGKDIGTYFGDNLNIMQQQGIDTRADYTQGDYDNTNLPTFSETANASHIRLASYNDVSGSNLQNWIETKLAGGDPVAIGIPVYPEFDHASAANPLVGLPKAGETSRGGHAVFASKYDANGLWIENSWGTSFGLNGWAELSWSFVNQYADEAVSEVPLSPGGPVPNVRGETFSLATSIVHAAGFAVALASAPDPTCENIRLVYRESPAPGSFAVYGSTVTLTVGTRPRTPCP
jgi:Papain family cysteine protease